MRHDRFLLSRPFQFPRRSIVIRVILTVVAFALGTNPGTGHAFTATIFYVADVSTLSLSGGNDVVIIFTPVPEPASVVAVCAIGAGIARVLRRRNRSAKSEEVVV